MTDPDTRPAYVRHAEDAYESYRAINHGAAPQGLPAPGVYAFLGETKAAAWSLAQALEDVGSGLVKSLDHYAVYDQGDPQGNAEDARARMGEAAALARQINGLLERAQGAIAEQGYKDTDGEHR